MCGCAVDDGRQMANGTGREKRQMVVMDKDDDDDEDEDEGDEDEDSKDDLRTDNTRVRVPGWSEAGNVTAD